MGQCRQNLLVHVVFDGTFLDHAEVVNRHALERTTLYDSPADFIRNWNAVLALGDDPVE